MTSARGGRATISRAPIGSSAGWARTQPHAELQPALHLHADCGLRAARFDRHLGHAPRIASGNARLPLQRIRSRRCEGVNCVTLNSWGDNPTAEAKAGGRDEAFGSRSNAVHDAGCRWGPRRDSSSQGHVAGNRQNSPVRDHGASLRIAAERGRARSRGDPHGHGPRWPADLGHDIVRQQRQQGTLRLGAVCRQQDDRGRRFRRLLPDHNRVGRPVREMLCPQCHGAVALHRRNLLHDGSRGTSAVICARLPRLLESN